MLKMAPPVQVSVGGCCLSLRCPGPAAAAHGMGTGGCGGGPGGELETDTGALPGSKALFVAHLKMCQDWNRGTRNCGLECSKLKGMYRRQNGQDNVKRQHQNVSAVTFPQDCWIRIVTRTAVIHMHHHASLGYGLHGHFKKWSLHTLNKAFTQI
ncbi:dexamethasone-induced protein isoform X1 [Dermochelys coriacea]|uniref:dexamethasone-induced protein isoform X1 n=1 Tax=Dermochelys coriacea TaxID=27794 RepID=UPI0018E867EC|nr:dexamethasone-induced protein isoform X1 [Dermochelys coriacea]